MLNLGDDRGQLALREPSGLLLLSIRSGDPLPGPVRFRYALEGLRTLEPKLATLRRLVALGRGRARPDLVVPGVTQAPRWHSILRAYDLSLAGASQREIAVDFFGGDMIEREWRAQSDFLRLRIQRLLNRTRRLIGGDYRALLQER